MNRQDRFELVRRTQMAVAPLLLIALVSVVGGQTANPPTLNPMYAAKPTKTPTKTPTRTPTPTQTPTPTPTPTQTPPAAQTGQLWVGPNVNMVSGTTWPDGDPYLQRQNEPSIAVSTRNSLHLLAGANDYRTVDLPGLPEGKETGDAWLGLFRSVDGGESWKSTLVRGYPQDQESDGVHSPLHDGYEAAADPVVRAGTHGLFYYSGIVFERSLQRSAAFVQRFMDLNNETVEPVRYIDTVLVDSFNAGEAFIDKPWLEVDIPRPGAQTVTLSVPQGSGTVSQPVPCGNVYMAWAEITGQGTALRTQIMFTRSTNCGGTWSNPVAISVAGTVGQGATIAVAPSTGRVYVAWRQFRLATVDCVREKAYWKDTSNAWPVASLVVGGKSYTKQEALVILQKSYPPSDAPGILAQQLIPAKLNVLSGADSDAIEQVITEADAWLKKYPLGSTPTSAQKQAGLALKDKLEAFNKGLAGSPTCTAATTSYPDAVLVVRSDNAGQTFGAPLQVAAVSPFDQGTSEYSFRTNAYPTMAVDETGRAYLAWATRGLATPNADSVAGDARIVVTTSKDGATWTTPQPIDQPKLPGHQLFPSLTYNTGKLLLVYNDYRADASGVFERFIVDLMDATHPMRHTVDVRAAGASPADVPLFTDYSLLNPSSQVSRYPFIVTGTSASDAKSLQLQYNPPNLPMFEKGTKPFFGDYHDVAGAPRFVPNANGTWSYNTAPSAAPVFHAVWTDNRDVVGPPDGHWENYVPPGGAHDSKFDGSPVPGCQTAADAERTQMRNQNIYTSRLVSGLYVAVPSNSRPLSLEFQRAFVIFVQNATDTAKQFRLQILNQPDGGTASFQQFSAAPTRDVMIGAYSSISETVFVKSSSATASVDVRVRELGSCSNSNTCLESTVRINPDSSNPPPADDTLLAREIYNPAVLNPTEYNPAVLNPAVLNTGVLNPAVLNPAVLNYGVGNPAVYNPAVYNPAVYNAALLDAFNIMMMSLAFLNPAVYNPAILNPAVYNPGVLNPAVYNPAVLNPAVLNPAVYNPAVLNPAVLNPAVLNPAVYNQSLTDRSVTEANYVAQNAGNTTMAYSFNLRLGAPAPSGLLYQLLIYRLYFTPVANGCELTEAPQQELLVNDLAPNLNASLLDPNAGDSFFLNPGDVAIATLRVIPDPTAPTPGDPSHFPITSLSASVVSKGVNTPDVPGGEPPFAPVPAADLLPLVITTNLLPSTVVGSAYGPLSLTATGGSGPRTWALAPGSTLPPGLNLSTSGVLTGTPTTSGSFIFTVRLSDFTQLVEKALSVSVSPNLGDLVYSAQPGSTTAGQVIPSFSVTALDPTASPAFGVSITVAIGHSACSACTLSGTTTRTTGPTGIAAFSDLRIDRGGSGYTLVASATAGATTITRESAGFSLVGFCETGSMGASRVGASMTRLADGRVLVVGGADASNTPLASAEIYDPATGTWTATGSLSLGARSLHTATLLPLSGGRVLIAGGSPDPLPASTGLSTAEIFDPTTGTFSATGGLTVARMAHTATLLANGKVLLAGGRSSGPAGFQNTAELYDPNGGTFTSTGNLTTVRDSHTATLLSDGRVLLVGGLSAAFTYLNSAEIFNPTSGTFSSTGSMSTARINHTATLLNDGRVLVAGGTATGGNTLASAEIYDAGPGAFSAPVPMSTAREQHTAALLSNGHVLLAGGYAGSPPLGVLLSSAETFDPAAAGGAGASSTTHGMANRRHLHVTTNLSDGRLLVAGGYGSSGSSIAEAEVFSPISGQTLWTRQFGTASPDYATSISVDAQGVYVAGGTPGPLPGQSSYGSTDAFVRKYDLDGTEVWTRQFGTASYDFATSISVDGSGVYVAGSTQGTFPGQTSSGYEDAFVRKYDFAGNVLWTRQFGPATSQGISVAASGVYVAGYTGDTLPGQISLGLVDAFVRKCDLDDGHEIWTRQFGTADFDYAFGISVDASGVYVAGETSGTLQGPSNAGGQDAFVRKYDPDGNALWTRQFGTAGADMSAGISVAASGVYVAGYTGGPLPGQTSSGGQDAFVRTYGLDGNEVWTHQFGTTWDDFAWGISVDASGVYVAGWKLCTVPGTCATGDEVAFVRTYDLAGNALWTRQFGSLLTSAKAGGIWVGGPGVYVAGYTYGTLEGQTSAGGVDAFIMKLVK